MADFSMSDMPWLGQPADPAGSLLRGVQAGAAISGARTQRTALAQRKMEFDQQASIQEREWREKMAMLPLEMTLKQQQNQINAFHIEDILTQRQSVISSQSVMNGLTRELYNSMSDPDKGPEHAQQQLLQAIVHSPEIVDTPRFQKMSKLVETSLASKLALIEARNKLNASQAATYTPGFGQAVNPETGKTETFWRSGAGSAQLVGQDVNKPQSTMGKLIADRNSAKLAGDTEAVSAFDAEIKMRQTKDGFSITTNPDGTVTVTQGKQDKGTVPTAMVTKSEESIAGAVNAAKLGSTLLNKLRPEDVGILGRGGEIVVDQTLAQVVPGAANLQRVNARSLLRLFRNDFTRALKFDSQLSNEERQRIEAMLPGEGTNESLPSALEKIRTATKEVAERARFNAQRANRPLPNELLKPAELIERVKKGEITWQQATEIAKMSPFRDEFDNFVETK